MFTSFRQSILRSYYWLQFLFLTSIAFQYVRICVIFWRHWGLQAFLIKSDRPFFCSNCCVNSSIFGHFHFVLRFFEISVKDRKTGTRKSQFSWWVMKARPMNIEILSSAISIFEWNQQNGLPGLPHIPSKTIKTLKLKNSWTQSSLCRWVSCDSYKKCHTFCSFAGPIIAIHFRLVSALLSHLEFVKCCCCFTTTTRVVLSSVFFPISASDTVFFREIS